MKQKKQTKKLEEDVSKLQLQLNMLKRNFNEFKRPLIVEIKQLRRDVNKLNDRLGDVEEIRTDVDTLNGRVGNLCQWGDDGESNRDEWESDKCYKLRIGEFEIANYPDKNDACLRTYTSEQEVSYVCHEKNGKNAERNFFTFYTGEENSEDPERRKFHLNPFDAHVNIYGFPPGESTNDRIDALEEK
eukprot:CAMPEP_0194320278 /NCGR_PEP_ID=MMETSP0171-20130528/16628_1 /TAXON_ID=218684 /ORGANISM="Corethron pennatum, Strain L29A3" /LENGTH=186 /DNA_ID=CAMNT_0039077765 /DNA_START=185 /DNA_END=745 /DNA_ORIENTATION=+